MPKLLLYRSQERLNYPIHDQLKQLEDLKTSLQTKWSKIKGKGTKTIPNTKSSNSNNAQSWVANVSEVIMFAYAHPRFRFRTNFFSFMRLRTY